MPEPSIADPSHVLVEDRARKAFDASRTHAANAMGKATALWVAALAVVWLSGLEPTYQSVAARTQGFAERNRVAQIVQRQIVRKGELAAGVAARKVAEAEYLLRPGSIDSEREERNEEVRYAKNRLEELQKSPDTGTHPPSVPQLNKEVELAEKRIAAFNDKIKELGLEDKDDERRKVAVQNLEVKLQKAVNDAKSEIATQQENFDTQREQRKESLSKQDRSVSFELVGFKFNSPPLLAPLLWSACLLSLLAYLTQTRVVSTAHAVEGTTALSSLHSHHPDAFKDKIGRLPFWASRPVMTALRNERAETGSNPPAEPPWICHVFGSRRYRASSFAAVVASAWLALLFQTRVSWLALELSHHLGSNLTRQVIPLAVLLLMLPTIAITCWWIGDGEKIRCRWLVSAAQVWPWLVVGMAAGVAAFYVPGVRGSFDTALQSALPLALFLPLPFFIAAIHRMRSEQHRPLILPKFSRVITRRNFLAAAAISMGGISALFFRPERTPRFRRRKKPARHVPEMESGFYRRMPSQDPRHAVVLHYVDTSHSMWRGGRRPRHVTREKRLRTNVDNRFPASEKIFREAGIPRPTSAETRVHLASSSWAFEEEVTRALGRNELRSIDAHHACGLLLNAIKHDVIFKRGQGRPGFRLYDLLAGLAVRFRHPDHLDSLIEAIENSGQTLSFSARIDKWRDPKSNWWKRWRDHKKSISWSTSQHVVVF
ncbi:MAG TPA: hypothetical protein VGE39_11310 [Prosthecobacter sp.]